MRVTSSEDITPGEIRERPDGSQIRITGFFGTPTVMEPGPQGHLVEMITGGSIEPHFHAVTQFQVVVAGDGVLGKKSLQPISFHYADPYTPYGPIIPGKQGLAFFTLRPEPSDGFYPMPGSRDKMSSKAGRNIASHFEADCDTAGQLEPVVREMLIERQPDGLQVTGIRIRPNAEAEGVDPTGSGGQYYLVTGGTLFHKEKELPKNSLLFVEPVEAAPTLQAGASGASVLVLQYPKSKERTA